MRPSTVCLFFAYFPPNRTIGMQPSAGCVCICLHEKPFRKNGLKANCSKCRNLRQDSVMTLKSWAWQRACGFDSRPRHQFVQQLTGRKVRPGVWGTGLSLPISALFLSNPLLLFCINPGCGTELPTSHNATYGQVRRISLSRVARFTGTWPVAMSDIFARGIGSSYALQPAFGVSPAFQL